MVKVTELKADEAKRHFLQGESYFNADTPPYLGFGPLLKDVADLLKGKFFTDFKESKPDNYQDVNYKLLTNKDGRFAWRQLELIHPAIYVSIVNLICQEENWAKIVAKFQEFSQTCVQCTSIPQVSEEEKSDKARQVQEWWHEVEQASLKLAIEYRYLCSVDVADCYGSLYTHSIGWALDGYEKAKSQKCRNELGSKIDEYIRACRFGQTNGIPQGSVLSDFVAEIILGYVDTKISERLDSQKLSDFSIIRYRDDYRIFTNDADTGELIVQAISQSLIEVGMRLNTSKTKFSDNIISGSLKPDKMEALHLIDIGSSHAKTIQKQMLRIHELGLKYPNSGSINKLLSGLFNDLKNNNRLENEDISVLMSILTDMALKSPRAIPAISALMTLLFQQLAPEQKSTQWTKVTKKIQSLPNHSYQEIWLQRITVPRNVELEFHTEEKLCKVVQNKDIPLWNNDWISWSALKNACNPSKIVISDPLDAAIIASSDEFDLFPDHSF